MTIAFSPMSTRMSPNVELSVMNTGPAVANCVDAEIVDRSPRKLAWMPRPLAFSISRHVAILDWFGIVAEAAVPPVIVANNVLLRTVTLMSPSLVTA